MKGQGVEHAGVNRMFIAVPYQGRDIGAQGIGGGGAGS